MRNSASFCRPTPLFCPVSSRQSDAAQRSKSRSSRMVCSQKRFCQREYSPRLSREIGAPVATTLRVKLPLIRLHRSEKSESPGGNVRIACRWSGRITMASVTNGRSLCVVWKAVRNSAIWSISADDLRSSSVTVKKNVPPGQNCADSGPWCPPVPDYASLHPGYEAHDFPFNFSNP